MTTAVTALFASLFGGAIGAVVTTWLRVRLERQERWRDRLVEAANDFSVAAFKAHHSIREASRVHIFGSRPTALDSEPVSDALLEATRDVDSLHVALARVRLLFGIESEPEQAAAAVLSKLREAINTMRAEPPEPGAFGEAIREAGRAEQAFCGAAREVVRPDVKRRARL